MMWRALMRRCPTKSFTVVGDVAQTSSAAGTRSWEQALSPFVQERLEVSHLTVNYRTPARIMDRAQAVAHAHALPITDVSSVREGERSPLLEQVAADELAPRAAAAVQALHAERIGRIAVITAPERMSEVLQACRASIDLPYAGVGSAGVDDEIAVMTAQDAKGLEFDAVVVVEPIELLEGHDRGAGDLYVALTRATQHLGIVHARPLPTGISRR